MQIVASGAPAALIQSLEEEMVAAGVPGDASVFARYEAPYSVKGIASLGVKDFWFFAKSEGNPAVVKRAESEDEKAAAQRALSMAQYEEPPLSQEQTLESARFEDQHDTSAVADTPDMEGGDHPEWKLQRAENPLDALKSLNRRLAEAVPMVERLHPLQKSFLLSIGMDNEAIASGEVNWTPDMKRRYSKWLARGLREQSHRMMA